MVTDDPAQAIVEHCETGSRLGSHTGRRAAEWKRANLEISGGGCYAKAFRNEVNGWLSRWNLRPGPETFIWH